MAHAACPDHEQANVRNHRRLRALITRICSPRVCSPELTKRGYISMGRRAPRLASGPAAARVSSRAGQASKSARRIRRPARDSSGGSARLAAVEDAGINDDVSRSNHRECEAWPRRPGQDRAAAARHVRGIDRSRSSGKAARADPPAQHAGNGVNLDWARDAILAEVPKLRAFAISLCGNPDQADDFVQETLLRAWTHIDQFQRGTNMAAWLFTILRNSLRSNYRKYRREIEDADGSYAERMITQPEQNGRLEFEELRAALAKLPSDQRETLVLVVASGASYEEAAEICGCRVGTIKSRVHRARARLAQMLAIDSVDDFAPDRTTQSVLRGALG